MYGAGRGILLTQSQQIPSGLDWAAVLLGANLDSRVAQLRSMGVSTIYVWDHPRAWRPETWRDGRRRCVEACRRLGLAGYIADGENGWEPTGLDAEADAFGDSMESDARSGLDVGFTSFPGFRYLRRIASKARSLWGACQIYNRGSRDQAVFARWLETFRSAFPRSIVVCATFVPRTATGSDLSTREGYRAYLGRLPQSYGLASYGSGPSYMFDELAIYRPALSMPVIAPAIGFLAGWLGDVPMPVVLAMAIAIAVLLVGGTALLLARYWRG